MTEKIHWILVNYNSSELINKLILNYPVFSFVIVDNSGDFILKTKNIDVRILVPKSNIGYLGGFIFAIKNLDLVKEKKVIFSNSDIAANNIKDIINKFISLGKLPIVISPKIMCNGRNQNPHIIHRPSKSYWILRLVFSSNSFLWRIWKFLGFLRKKYKFQKTNIQSKNFQIYSGHGSFYIFNNIDFNNLINKKFNFLFGEEVHFSEFLIKSGYKLMYVDNLVIHHYENSTTSSILSSRKRKFFHESYINILNYY